MSGAPTGFTTPKTDWVAANAITSADLNRAEGNSLAIETGSRTLDQDLAAPANTGTLRQIISWFAGRIRAITGAANWWDAPATTLAAASTHASATTAIHGVGGSTVESVAGATAKVDTHAALTTAHSATSTPTANRIMMWDAAMRAKVAAPAAADDIARLDTVTTHAGATTGIHGVGGSTVESVAGATAKVNVVRYVSINTQTVSYTLVLADDARLIDMNSASALTLTVPTNATVPFPIGTQILVRQVGAGQVTISPISGVTLNAAGGRNKTRIQFSVAGLIKIATDTWAVFGDLSV